MQYLINTKLADAVRIWHIDFNSTIADNTNIPYGNSTDVYNDGELYKTISVDETGNAVAEYKDKEGHVILKKVQIGSIATDFSGYSGFLCTYYVYDDLGQLRTVLQPKAVAAMASANNWVMSQTTVNELCFRYEYDQRQRMIAKKVPGAGWVYMVYDSRDRLVFTQDANMRSKSPQQWMYTLYDEINRPVQSGVMGYTGTWSNLITYVNGLANSTASNATSGTNINTNPVDMYINNREYGRQDYQATNSITFDDGFTSENNATFTAQIVTEPANTFNTNVSVNTYPVPAGTTLYPLTYTYYDDYSATTKAYNNSNNAKLDNGGNANAEALPAVNSNQTKGMVTITKVRVIEDPNNLSLGKWLETANFVDDKGRVIQVQSTNYKGGTDIITNRYDFTGKVVSNYMVHNNVSGNVNNLSVATSMNYDHVGRLKTITKVVNDDAINNKRVIVTNAYDALGQLKNKKIGQKSATDISPLEDDDYNYNIRGWLKDINWYNSSGAYASQMNSTTNKWFTMDISYDWGFDNNSSQFNGNISGTRWKTAGDGQERAYGFKYDASNRLLKADFTQNNSGWNITAGVNFSMQMGDGAAASSAYDENGNIKFMQQYGLKGVSSAIIDKMTYLYKQTSQVSNQLLAVTEDPSIATTDNKLGDFTDKNRTADDYNYDANGNLLYDKNKKITLIEYNHLNLPWRLTVQNDDGTSKGTIVYIYDAAGNKLEKRTNESASSYNSNTAKQTTTTYLSGFVYENNKLQFFGHEEGRIRYKQIIDVNNQPQTNYVYDYFLKDHLGNVRMVLTEDQQQDKYPALSFEGTAGTQQVTDQDAMWDNSNGQAIDVINTRTAKPPGFTYNSNSSAYAKLVRKSTGSIGAAKLLKVMSGDKVDVSVDYYYTTNADNSTANGLNSFLGIILSIINGGDNVSPQVKADGNTIVTNLTANTAVTSFFSPENTGSAGGSTPPKAYLHVLLFDELFVFDNVNSYVEQVKYLTPASPGNQIIKTGISVKKNGYAYVYFSNESNDIVYFDNFMLTHNKGPLLEETHYYPFGLTMAGISSKAAGGLLNKRKFNDGTELQSGEFSDGSGLELYATQYRSLDPQIGRFWQLDPLDGLSHNSSLYAFASNNPILRNDPLGLKDTVAVDNKVLPTIYISIPKKKEYVNGSAGFYWPEDNATKEQINQENNDRYLAMDRLAHNQKLLQGGESDNYKNKVDWYKLIYKNEKDYKTMSLAASLIIMSPLLVSASPEIAALIRELPALMNATGELYGDVGLKVYEILSKLSFEARISTGILGGMISSGTSNLSQQQLQKIFDAVNTLSKYDNSGAMKDVIRNLGPIVGALKRHLQK